MKEYTRKVLQRAEMLSELEQAALMLTVPSRRQFGLRYAVMLAVALAGMLFPGTGAGCVW